MEELDYFVCSAANNGDSTRRKRWWWDGRHVRCCGETMRCQAAQSLCRPWSQVHRYLLQVTDLLLVLLRVSLVSCHSVT